MEDGPTINVQPESVTVRAGETISLTVTANSPNGSSFQWRKHGFPIAGATADTFEIPAASLTDSGFYDVVVTDPGGASLISERVRVTVFARETTGLQEIDPNWVVPVDREGGVLRKIAPTKNGGLLIAGEFNEFKGHRTQGLVRLDADGDVDRLFSAQLTIEGTIDGIFERPDGRILILGYITVFTPLGTFEKGVRLMPDGTVDPTFRITEGANANWESVAVAGDGSIYVGGQLAQAGTPNNRLVFRLHPDGELDSEFRTVESNSDWVSRIQLTATGAVLALYTSGDYDRPGTWLLRIGSNGAVDENFDPDLSMFGYVSRFEVADDGRIYLYGVARSTDEQSGPEMWQRYSAEGQIDLEYGGTGETFYGRTAMAMKVVGEGTMYVLNNSSEVVRIASDGSGREKKLVYSVDARPQWDLLVLPDGRVILVGGLDSNGRIRGAIVEVSADLTTTQVDDGDMFSPGIVNAIVPTSDGGYVVGGNFNRIGSSPTAFLAKITAAGHLDASFASNGAPDSVVQQIVAEGSGNWLVGGGFSLVGGASHPGVFRLLADGTIDETHETSRFWQDLRSQDRKSFLLPLPEGQALVGGTLSGPGGFPAEQRIFRLQNNGQVDISFSPTLSELPSAAYAAMEQTNGDIVVGGDVFSYAAGAPLARLRPGGTIDSDYHYQPDAHASGYPVSRMVGAGGDSAWILNLFSVELRTPDGGLDSEFDVNRSGVNHAASFMWGPFTLLPQADASLVLAGEFSLFDERIRIVRGLVRFLANGALDESFRIYWSGGETDTALQRDDGGFVVGSPGQVWRSRPLQAPAMGDTTELHFVGPGETFALTPTVEGWPTHFQWYRNGLPLQGETYRSLIISEFSAEDAGFYTLVASNAAGRTRSGGHLLRLADGETQSVAAVHYCFDEHRSDALAPAYEISAAMALSALATNLDWSVLLPDGWTLDPLDDGGATTAPSAGTSGLAEWTWTAPSATELRFSYRLLPPEAARGLFEIDAMVTATVGGETIEAIADPAPLVIRRGRFHDADMDQDMRLGLTELLRVIELYNTRVGTTRTGRYDADAASPDGFATDSSNTERGSLVRYHAADTDRDGQLSLTELLRVIQLYNTRSGTTRTGAYRVGEGTVDGFEPGEGGG